MRRSYRGMRETTKPGSIEVSSTTATFRVIAAYKFTRLDDLALLRQRLAALCESASLKGTISLSPEGINIFIGGTRPDVDAFLNHVRTLPGLEHLEAKVSESAARPFKRMLIKIKKQIICFDDETIDPSQGTSPKLPPTTLKQWLDEGRPVTLLDTRNEYEVRIGTFAGAIDPGIANFRDFPTAVQRLPEALRDQPVVIFCTGGIRCEKAGPYLEQQGFTNIHQLEGGILKYFEECGGAHYNGDCFVFDERVAVDSQLRGVRTAMVVIENNHKREADNDDRA
jgi:predicted sulfurtransferase